MLLHHYRNMLTFMGWLARWGAHEVLEFGCGSGVNLLLLQKACEMGVGLELSGFDYSDARVLTTRATTEHFGLDIRNLFLGNGVSLPLKDNSFDVVFSHYVVEQMSGYEDEALNEMLRVARTGVVLFETAAFKPTLNQRVYMRHSGYSRDLPRAVRERSDVEVEEMRNVKEDRFFGAPNLTIVLKKR